MANATNYWGLRPVKHIDGSPWNGLTEKCYIAATYGTAMYIGDNVMINNAAADADDTALYCSVERAGLTDGLLQYGVITSFDDHEDCSKVYNPTSTERYINVCVDPSVVYHVRDDGSGTPANTWHFNNCELAAGTSSTVTGLSGIGILGSSVTHNQSLPFLILRRANLPDNELADNAIWEVMINCHQLHGGATGRILGVEKA